MRFKLDENLPIEAAEVLRKAGHDTETVLDEGLAGAPDSRVAEVAAGERRVLMTLDLDFADVRQEADVKGELWIVSEDRIRTRSRPS